MKTFKKGDVTITIDGDAPLMEHRLIKEGFLIQVIDKKPKAKKKAVKKAAPKAKKKAVKKAAPKPKKAE